MKLYHKAVALFLSLVFVFSCFSCAETPDKDIVVNKGEGTLEDKIKNSTGSGLDIDIDTSDNNEGHDFVTSFTSSGGDVTFNINADVSYPDIDAFPALKVKPHFFTSEELEKIANTLFLGNEIYEYTEELTKSQIEEDILEIKQFIGDKDYLMEYYDGDEDTIALVVSNYEKRLAALELAYQTASDNVTNNPPDYQFHEDSYYHPDTSLIGGLDGVYSMNIISNVDNIPMYMRAAKRNDDERVLSNIYAYPYEFRTTGLDISDFFQTEIFTEDDLAEAFTLVENTLSDIGFDEWKIHSYALGDYSVIFYCTPEYYGIQMSNVLNYFSLSSDLDYRPSFSYPTLEITVSDGKILSFWLTGALETDEILNENVELLSYSEALERIYEQLEITYTKNKVCELVINDPRYSPVSGEVNVSYIELCLARVNIKNDPDSYYIIPTWMVYGTASLTEYTVMGENVTSTMSRSEEVPLLAVNAIDGSVIDMSQGY